MCIRDRRRGVVNITPQVQQAVDESGVREGLVLVNPMHITASVFINDNESGLHHDLDVYKRQQMDGALARSVLVRRLEPAPAVQSEAQSE